MASLTLEKHVSRCQFPEDMLDLPVGLVDILDGEDGKVAVVSEVAEGDARTGLDGEGVDLLLGDIESDGHGKESAIGETVVLDDSAPIVLVTSIFSGASLVRMFNVPIVVLLGHETYRDATTVSPAVLERAT